MKITKTIISEKSDREVEAICSKCNNKMVHELITPIFDLECTKCGTTETHDFTEYYELINSMKNIFKDWFWFSWEFRNCIFEFFNFWGNVIYDFNTIMINFIFTTLQVYVFCFILFAKFMLGLFFGVICTFARADNIGKSDRRGIYCGRLFSVFVVGKYDTV